MEELLREIRDELRSLRKLHENAFGIKTESIQELGVVDKPVTVKRLSISKDNNVMFEEEISEGRWDRSQVENICGRFAGLTTRLTKEGGEHGQVLYGYLEINADIVYSIRFNTEKNFPRLLISIILAASYEQLAGIVTLSVTAGTKYKSTRFPDLLDSFGFKIKSEPPISKEDWAQNRESYLGQAAAKIKAARSNAPMLGMGNNIQAIAPSLTSEPPEVALRKEIAVQAKSLWGDNYAEKAREHSATHFGGLSTKQMSVTQLEQYLGDIEDLKRQKQKAA